jgi:hypothetical protein
MKSGAIVACALALAGCASHAVATSLIGMTLAAALSGCANRPDSIHAEYISYERFAGLSCQELETSSEQIDGGPRGGGRPAKG